MANNISFSPWLKTGSSEGSVKAGFQASSAYDNGSSFKKSMVNAVKTVNADKETNQYTGNSLRKEMIGRAEAKLRSVRKPEAKEVNNADESPMTFEEMLSKLEELAALQQGNLTDEQKAMLESIKETLKKLGENGTLTGIDQTKMTALKLTLAGMINSLKDNGNLNGTALSDFANKLEELAAEAAIKYAGDPEDTVRMPDLEEEGTADELADSRNAKGSETDGRLAAESEKAAETGSGIAEDARKKSVTELNKATDTSTSDTMGKASQSATEENLEDVKAALDSKLEKVTVEEGKGKESGSSNTEAENSRKAAETDTKSTAGVQQDKSFNEEAAAVNRVQTEEGMNLNALRSQVQAPRTQTVGRTELINQIVKKAELVITDTQSEMRMQLEPENLGKLTLKIAIEKGLVTAKFEAESHEVKQIIESSFNELKNLLQEKGFGVQNISVSVGKESKGYENGEALQQWKETVRLNGKGYGRTGGYEGYLEGDGIASRPVNPYSIHIGLFDHRA